MTIETRIWTDNYTVIRQCKMQLDELQVITTVRNLLKIFFIPQLLSSA